jgi:hypothetical protein
MSNADTLVWLLEQAQQHLLAIPAQTAHLYHEGALLWADRDDIDAAARCALTDVDTALRVLTSERETS